MPPNQISGYARMERTENGSVLFRSGTNRSYLKTIMTINRTYDTSVEMIVPSCIPETFREYAEFAKNVEKGHILHQ